MFGRLEYVVLAGGREGIDRSWKSKVFGGFLEGKVGVVMARELLFTGKR